MSWSVSPTELADRYPTVTGPAPTGYSVGVVFDVQLSRSISAESVREKERRWRRQRDRPE